jgi:hypothetical protein
MSLPAATSTAARQARRSRALAQSWPAFILSSCIVCLNLGEEHRPQDYARFGPASSALRKLTAKVALLLAHRIPRDRAIPDNPPERSVASMRRSIMRSGDSGHA